MDLYAFKIYMLDVGLLLAMTDLDASVIIDGNRIFAEFKGALTEQYVLHTYNRFPVVLKEGHGVYLTDAD